jgi:hypothetical protein
MRKILISVLLTLITALTSLTVNAQPQESQTDIDTELTLKEAYHLGLDIALKWDSRVMLSRIGSVDDPNQEGSKGANGKRRKWGLMFVVPGERKSVAMYINSKKNTLFVTSKSTIQSEFLISPEEVVIDSPDALQKVKSKYTLKPGKDWAEGYHFLLYKWNGKTAMSVVGLDDGNKFTKIFLNAKSGEFIN